jgi:hypothetical protein
MCCTICAFGTSRDLIGDHKALQLELKLLNPALLDKPQVKLALCCNNVTLCVALVFNCADGTCDRAMHLQWFVA